MAEIQGTALDTSKFYPMVGIGRQIGQYVKGRVIESGTTKNKNVALTIELDDMEGTTSIQVSKGIYQEVPVKKGDRVQLVANLTDLKDKLPKVKVGQILTVRYTNDVPSGKGNPKKVFFVDVE